MTGFGSVSLIALGANLPSEAGPPAITLRDAIAQMPGAGLDVRAVSRFFATPCFPAGAGPDYVNAAVMVRTALSPGALLDVLHDIENRFGRTRTRRWGMRTLDLDLLAVGALVVPDAAEQARWRDLDPAVQAIRAPDRLILPHPRMQDRAFVLVPVCDIAPDWTHPLTGQSMAALCAALPAAETGAVRPL